MKFTFPTNTPTQFFREITPLKKTWEYRAATIAVITQLIIAGAAIAWFWRNLPPAIPLWYSRPWGDDRLVSPWFLLLPIGTSLLIYILNALVVVRVLSDHPMFARALYLTSVLVSVLSGFLIIRIILLVA